MAATAAGALAALLWNARDPWSVLAGWVLASILASALAAAALPRRADPVALPRAHQPRRADEDPARRLLMEEGRWKQEAHK